MTPQEIAEAVLTCACGLHACPTCSGLAGLLRKMDEEAYTGPVVLHTLHGKPKLADMGGRRFALDNGVKRAQA